MDFNIASLLKKTKCHDEIRQGILGFFTIPRDTKDNRHSGQVGFPNKRNYQNSFVKSAPT